jgi:ribosomal protein L40E
MDCSAQVVKSKICVRCGATRLPSVSGRRKSGNECLVLTGHAE